MIDPKFEPPKPFPPTAAPEPHEVTAARSLKCEVAAVVALRTVETGGLPGFLDDGTGRPRILFEAKYFHDLTRGRYDATHPSISSPVWDQRLYIGGGGEYTRLDAAKALDEAAAYQSASWGLFQVMGAHYAICGYKTPSDFVTAMYRGESWHYAAFVSFVQSKPGLWKAIQDRDWVTVARLYNGPAYRDNFYDTRLDAAYRRAASLSATNNVIIIGARSQDVARIQGALRSRGYKLALDGIFGPATQLALMDFQAKANLVVDGIVGPRTRKALGI